MTHIATALIATSPSSAGDYMTRSTKTFNPPRLENLFRPTPSTLLSHNIDIPSLPRARLLRTSLPRRSRSEEIIDITRVAHARARSRRGPRRRTPGPSERSYRSCLRELRTRRPPEDTGWL
jgi:hypothetical protein